MKPYLLFFTLLLLTFSSYSQITFEEGYYVTNSNETINCFIKNVDWKNNPTEFKYQLSPTEEIKVATIEKVKEFGINNVSKYVRATVDIDKSKDNNESDLDKNRNPKFTKEQLFLEVLVDGEATLYKYTNGNLTRFFYSNEKENIEQLVFKKYLNENRDIARNNMFQRQLWSSLRCSTINMSDIERLEYTKSDLIQLFNDYNACKGGNVVDYKEKQQKDWFNLTLRPRLNSSSFKMKNSISNIRDIDFGNKVGFGFGIEPEFILPFNNGKWALTLEPTYQSFSATDIKNTNKVNGGTLTSDIEYKSIEMPIGARYYSFLNDDSKLFFNGALMYDFSFDSTIISKRADGSLIYDALDTSSKNNIALGLGYKYKNQFSAELRHQTDRDILENYNFWDSNYSTQSLIIGYSIF